MPSAIEFVNQVFDRFDAGDVDWCRAALHPEFRYESKLTPALGLDAITGPDATLQVFFEHLPATFEEFSLEHFGMTQVGPDQVLCGVTYRGRGRHSHVTVEQTFWKVFTIEDGQLLSMVEYESPAEARAATRSDATTVG